MNCQECQALLPTCIDGEVSAANELRVQAHLQHCNECLAAYKLLNEEIEMIRGGWLMKMLPDDFAHGVMQRIEDEGIEVEKSHDKQMMSQRSMKKRTLLIPSFVAAAVLFVAIGTYVSPSFASFLSSFFQTIKGELGLRQAAKQGFSTELNQVVSDNGITLRVKEVVADPTRIVLSYVLEDSKGQLLPDLYFPTEGSNKLYVTDTEGKVIRLNPLFRRLDHYADLVFPLQNPPEQVTVHLEIKGIGSLKDLQTVDLNMTIPVDLRQGFAATKQIMVDQQYTSSHGITVRLGQLTYAPSATQLEILTDWSLESKEKVQQQVEELQAKGVRKESAAQLLSSYHIDFTLQNKEGKILVDSRKHNFYTESGLIYSEIRSDEQQTGNEKGYYYFTPFVESSEDVFFHLEDIIVTQKADFSLAVPLHSKGKWGGEYEGHYYEVQEVQEKKTAVSPTSSYILAIDSIERFEFEDSPEWLVTDKEGRTYKAEYDLEKSSIYSDEKGEHHMRSLIVKEVPKGVNELTLSLVTVKKQLPQVGWKIKLPR